MATNYVFTESENGFRIEAPNRAPVEILFKPTYLEVVGPEQRKIFGIFEYYKFSAFIGEVLISGWKWPKHFVQLNRYPDGLEYIPRWLNRWAACQVAKGIGKRVHSQWQRYLATKADPQAIKVQKAIFAATKGAAFITFQENFYAYPLVVSDVTHYRAAAISAYEIERLYNTWRHYRLENSKYFKLLKDEAQQLGAYVSLNIGPDNKYELNFEKAILAMQNWRDLFSVTSESYRSLDRTLANLPGGVPARCVCNLSKVLLQHPINSRSVLTLLGFFVDGLGTWTNGSRVYTNEANIKIIMNANTKQVIDAIRRVGIYTHNDLNYRKSHDLHLLARFLLDYPKPHKGNLVGLADKAIRWHRDWWEQEITEVIDRLGPDTATALPCIPLPSDPRITFLASVKDICNEGQKMYHCIASFAQEAVQGYCFLFHVEKDGEMASVQVNCTGQVVQSYGPWDRKNNAAKWGSRILGRWGKAFPEEQQQNLSIIRAPRPELFDFNLPF